MSTWYIRMLYILLLSYGSVAASDEPISATSLIHQTPLPQELSFLTLFDVIHIEGSPQQKEKIAQWLLEIAHVPKGKSTLSAIKQSGHQLLIKHSAAARLSAGRTIAPMTDNLTNGAGEDITIIFDADMPDQGTYQVYDAVNQLIEFTAVQNLYHELAHAMHQMNGTWRYFASERQAIEEENLFRTDLALMRNEVPRLRYRKAGVMMTQGLANQDLGY